MTDSLIRCGNGCGRMLTWERLTEGLRTSRGIDCEHCVAEKVMHECADAIGLLNGKREAFVNNGVAWIVAERER